MLPVSGDKNSLYCFDEKNYDSFRHIVELVLNPQEKEFFCFALVNKCLFNVCKDINPVIDKEAFHGKFTNFLNDSNIIDKKECAVIFHIEFIRVRIFKLFFNFKNKQSCYRNCFIDLKSNLLNVNFGSYVNSPGSCAFGFFNNENQCCYKSLIDYKIVSCHICYPFGLDEPVYYIDGKHEHFNNAKKINLAFLDFIRSYGIACGERNDLLFGRSELKGTIFKWTFCKDLKKIDSDYRFPATPKEPTSSLPVVPQKYCEFFEKGKYTDCTIRCADGAFKAHRLVLAGASETFDVMFNAPMKEKESLEIIFLEDRKIVNIFITYLYNGKNPFTSKAITEVAEAVTLMELAYRYEVKDLVGRCEIYIGKNVSAEDWEDLGEEGLLYDNKFLCEVANCYRIRQGKALSPKMKEGFQKLNLPCYSVLSQDVVVGCDVGFGNMLGICSDRAWHTVKLFKWTPKGWVGRAPLFNSFKFVCIRSNQAEMLWEQKGEDRRLSDSQEGDLQINDVKFG